MYSVEIYNRVWRGCHVEGMSRREAALLFGIDRKTVSKILQHPVPLGYRRSKSPARPKLDPFIPIIDQILEVDKSMIKKQRHTAKRIHARLRDEHGFTGGVECKLRYFVIVLPHSDAIFFKAYSAETTEAFCDGQFVMWPPLVRGP